MSIVSLINYSLEESFQFQEQEFLERRRLHLDHWLQLFVKLCCVCGVRKSKAYASFRWNARSSVYVAHWFSCVLRDGWCHLDIARGWASEASDDAMSCSNAFDR